MRKSTLAWVGAVCLTAVILSACGGSASAAPASTAVVQSPASAVSAAMTSVPTAASAGTPAQSAGTLDGQTLMQQRCAACHGLGRITRAAGSADQWKATVDQMIAFGAQLTPSEETILVNYLAQTYHP